MVSALEAAKAITRLEFTNRRQVLQFREQILAAIARDYGDLTGDNVANVLSVRNSFVVDMSARILTLPNFVTYQPNTSLPSVVAAHRYLGDYTREDEMRTWNATLHPLFMPPILDVLK